MIHPKASNLVLCFAIILLLWIGIIPDDSIIPVESIIIGNSPLASFLSQSFDFFSAPFIALSIAFLALISYLMVWINEDFSFISIRTILPAFFFLIISSLMIRPHAFSISFLIIFLFFMIVYSCFRLYESPSSSASVALFNSGLLLGMITLFSLSCFSFIIILFIYYYNIKALSFRSFLAFIMGLILPYLYSFGLFYLTDNIFYFSNYFTNWSIRGGSFIWSQMSLPMLIYLGILVLLTLFSMIKVVVFNTHQTIKNRQETLFLVHCFLLSSILVILSPSDVGLLLPLTFFFGSFLLGQAFSSEYNLLIKIMMGVFLLSSVLFLIFPNIN